MLSADKSEFVGEHLQRCRLVSAREKCPWRKESLSNQYTFLNAYFEQDRVLRTTVKTCMIKSQPSRRLCFGFFFLVDYEIIMVSFSSLVI